MLAGGETLRINVRKRGRKYDLDDGGAAVAAAGKPRGWLEVAERIVAEEGFNVNRAGVVFVSAFEGRDIERLAERLAATARDVHLALLELDR